ncbi:DNA replication complex GINS family protein [Candidatus Bathyarchaeota archaeon]|nr:DNA replication complex GINS family protein [Candidatus Bathyarchaeota archaeon]
MRVESTEEENGDSLQVGVAGKIKALDFVFENSPAKIIANRNCPEIKLAGLTIGPFEEGNDYEVPYWVALELQKFGVARFRDEETFDLARLHKIHWKERVQTTGQISELPRDFYPKLCRLLAELKSEAAKHPEKIKDFEKARQLALDVLNLRLKKIVSIASAPAQTEQILRNFTVEERLLYEQLYKLLNTWKAELLECGDEEK